MSNTVTDAEFNAAKIKYCVQIINWTKRFANILSDEARRASGDIALWRNLQNYKPTFGQSFPSSLYRYVRWECLSAIQENKADSLQILGDISDKEHISIKMILDDYLSLLSKRDRRIVEAKFLKSHTLKEIAQIEGYSKQGIKNIVDHSLAKMSKAALA